MILVDTFILEEMEVLTEEKNGQTCKKLRGVFQRADEANNNKRVYSKAILEREVTKLTQALNERRLMGELDHPKHDAVKLSNVSHLITNLHIKGNDVIGECELLNTPAGKVAQALVEGGVKVGISSRGMGTLSDGEDGTKNVNEDFKLVTFDLVADPSTRGAFPTLAESKQSVLVENIVKDTLDKAAKEKVFTTLLKQKLIEKTAKKGKKNDPLSIWRGDADFGHNNRKPRKRKYRTYDNAEEPTETLKVQELTGGGGDPHPKEPEHLAGARRSNETGQNITNQQAVKRKVTMTPQERKGAVPAKYKVITGGPKQGVFSRVKSAIAGLLPKKENASIDYSLLRSVFDQKISEAKKPGEPKKTAIHIKGIGPSHKIERVKPQGKPEGKSVKDLLADLLGGPGRETPRITSTGVTPRKKAKLWGPTDRTD